VVWKFKFEELVREYDQFVYGGGLPVIHPGVPSWSLYRDLVAPNAQSSMVDLTECHPLEDYVTPTLFAEAFNDCTHSP
jgi:hypothetical protein